MQRNDSCLASFFIGGIVGAGLGLLFAPHSGRELRGLISGKSRELADDAVSFVDKQRQAMQWRKDRLAAAIEAGRETYREEKGQA